MDSWLIFLSLFWAEVRQESYQMLLGYSNITEEAVHCGVVSCQIDVIVITHPYSSFLVFGLTEEDPIL